MSTPELITPASLRDTPLPQPGSSKRDRGDVLVIGGARRTPGAAMLTGLAALRVGAGRLTLAVAESASASVAAAFVEAGVAALRETKGGAIDGSSLDSIEEDIAGADCIVVGPGLDDADEALKLLESLAPLLSDDATVVLDAYALGVLPKAEAMRAAVANRCVLTPNSAELGRLLGRDVDDALEAAQAVAAEYGAVVTSKGFVADPSGGAWQVSTGHPGLATSGSGDVLAGAVAGILARGASAGDAARWASFIHAAAGDRLTARVGPIGFLARELTDELPPMLQELA